MDCTSVALFVMAGVSCAPAASVPSAQVPLSPVRTVGTGALGVRLGPVEWRHGWKAYVRVALHNTSSSWLWVDYGDTDGFQSVLRFEVKDQRTGATAPWMCATRSELASSSFYVMLGPGGEYSAMVNIDCYAINTLGPWRVTVHYKETAATLSSPLPDGVSWFVGEASSNATDYIPKADHPGIAAPRALP